jgi:cytoskeletal protein CcmA (bactofilin family)
LELLPTARITGDVEAKVLIVAAGACLNGKCITGESLGSDAAGLKFKNGNGKDKVLE